MAVWISVAVLGVADAQNAAARPQASAVEEIVVTARRRTELLEDTPVSVTAVSERTLRAAGAYRLDQVGELVPNLQYRNGIAGNFAEFYIRGVGAGSADIQFDPGVGLYIDGVYLPRSGGSLLNIVDVEQIEVLRGPQGTLFGKNSVGGTINVTTRKPHDELEAFALVRPGNLGSLVTNTMINVPIVEDWLLGRFATFSSQRDGYVFDSFRDELYSDQNEISFLGSVRVKPLDRVTIDVTGTWSSSETKGRAGRCSVENPDAPLAPIVGGFYPLCENTTLFRVTSDAAGLVNVKSYGTWGVLQYDAGRAGVFEDLTVKALGAWMEQELRTRVDVDNTLAEVTYLSNAGGSPFDAAPQNQRQVSGEIQLNGRALDGRIDFVTGVFAQWEWADQGVTTNAGPPLNSHTTTFTSTDNWTWAPFFQATAAITDWLSLTGGVRYTQDHKSLGVSQVIPDGPVLAPEASGAKLFQAWTPMASVATTVPAEMLPTWSDHLMAYFTYSQGFKGGGFNALPGGTFGSGGQLAAPFDPETLDNFEVGSKLTALDDRVVVNVALFYGEYRDIQKISLKPVGPIEDLVVERLTENAARATVKGFEVEGFAFPLDGLQINGSIGVTDARYDSFMNAISDLTNGPIDRSGETFNDIPEFTSFLSAQYSWGVGARGVALLQGWVTPRLEWYYQSRVHLNGPELQGSKQSGYNLLNARLSYDFWDDRAQVALWGRNLTDQVYVNWSTPTASTLGFVVNYAGVPRTFGGEISYRFR